MSRPLTHTIRAGLFLLAVSLTLPALARPGHEGRGDGPWPQQECKSAYGKTACGYDCVAAYGDVQCAAAPWGACESAYGKIVCGPDRVDRRSRRARFWRQVPKATCVSSHGRIACGWGCVTGGGGPICADEPGAECKSAYGKTACGFSCVAAYGDVKCARHADGRCVQSAGKVACSDGSGDRRAPRQECKSAYGKTACGYSCVAAYGQVQCASRPDGRCVASHGTITCSD